MCVCGEPRGKGEEERARESSCPSLSTSAFSNVPRSVSLCTSSEENGGEGRVRSMLLRGNAVFGGEMLFSFLFFAVDSVLACACTVHSARVPAMFEKGT